MCWCGVGDEGRPSLYLFFIRCLLVGDQVDDVVLRWARGPFTIARVLIVLRLCLGCLVLVVSSLTSRVVLLPMRLLRVSLDVMVPIVHASGADPALESLCV